MSRLFNSIFQKSKNLYNIVVSITNISNAPLYSFGSGAGRMNEDYKINGHTCRIATH